MDTPPRLREPCPEIATHEGSPGHGAALCLRQGDGVAPIHPPRAPARSCPPVFPAEFTGRLKRMKGTKTQSRFQLEFSSQKSSWACTEGICRNSYCFVLGASSGDATPLPGRSSGAQSRTPRPQDWWHYWGCPGAGVWASRHGVKYRACRAQGGWMGSLGSPPPLQSLQKDAVPSVQIIRSPKGN